MPIENFDAKKILSDIKASLLSYVADESPKVTEAITSYVAGAETRLTDLVSYMADGGEAKFLLDRLAEEKDILWSEILSLVILAKGVAQDALNNVQDILIQAIRDVLPENK